MEWSFCLSNFLFGKHNFTYETPIPKTIFAYENHSGITQNYQKIILVFQRVQEKNVRVQEEIP